MRKIGIVSILIVQIRYTQNRLNNSFSSSFCSFKLFLIARKQVRVYEGEGEEGRKEGRKGERKKERKRYGKTENKEGKKERWMKLSLVTRASVPRKRNGMI